MGELQTVNQFIAATRQARSPTDLHGQCDAIARDMGFEYFALAQIDLGRDPGERGLISITNFPLAWVDHLTTDTRVVDDPAYLASCRSLVGFRWSEIGNIIRLGRKQKAMLS